MTSYPKSKKVSRPYSDSNLNALKSKLDSTDWNALLAGYDASEQYEIFIEFINRAYCQSFPKKTKFVSADRKNNEWIDDEIFSKICLKSQIFRLYKNHEISKNDYSVLRNRLNKEIELKKKQYYQTLFLDTKNDMKKSWKTTLSYGN